CLSISSISSLHSSCTKPQANASPMTLVAVRRRSLRKSIVRMSEMSLEGNPRAVSTIIIVTRPALGMGAALIDARAA
ncbi:hypothetical protein PFISCL1PPCAC_8582, partial [Pristionchus fissidentatus]